MKQRNMTSIFLCCEDKILLLYRQGSKVVNNVWIGSAGGHFEPEELNDAEGCVLRELKEELGIDKETLQDLQLRYIMLRHVNGEVRVNYFFFAGLPGGMAMNLVSEEGSLQWFSYEEIAEDTN
jgi:8-oxo-dGTP diphosphatase